MKNRQILRYFVNLTGGLGNQLFQLAYSLNQNQFSPPYLVQEFGRPRLNSNGDAEILSFIMPFVGEDFKVRKSNFLLRKIIGHTLKVSEHPKGWEKARTYQIVCVIFTSVILSIHYRRWIKLVTKITNANVNLTFKSNFFYLGYFQGVNNWDLDATRLALSRLALKEYRENIEADIDYARDHNLIFLHLRLQDYYYEPDIGLLSTEYFEEALADLCKKKGNEEIWVFSDDHTLAKKILKTPHHYKIRFISEAEYSVSETFELMRYGSRYILSNSTFGWWAAFLCKKQKVEVITPEPWFKNLSYDCSLYLNGWIRRKAIWRINESN